MLRLRYFFILLFAAFVFCPSIAQNLSVRAMIDTAGIKIGQQTQVRLTVVSPRGETVVFPEIKQGDELTKGVEVLSVKQSDPTLDGEKSRVYCDYLITSFEPGQYILPPFFVHASSTGNKFQSNELSLEVLDVTEAVQEDEFKDIRPVYEPPFDLLYLVKVLGGILLLLVLLAVLACYAYKKIKNRKKEVVEEKKEVEKIIILQAHEIALAELERIKREKIWRSGNVKEYHTQITDVIRKYIEDKFSVATMERTSTEILDSLRYKEAVYPVFDKLNQMLSVADMVKFARYEPSGDENEISLLNAFAFVNETKSYSPHNIPQPNNPASDSSMASPTSGSSPNSINLNKEGETKSSGRPSVSSSSEATEIDGCGPEHSANANVADLVFSMKKEKESDQGSRI